jgi:hypothetical protein
MNMRAILLAAAISLVAGSYATHAYDPWPTGSAGTPDAHVLSAQGVPGGTPLGTSDTQGAPVAGAVALTVGVAATPLRAVGVLATVAGNVTFQFPDGSTLTLPVYGSPSAPIWQIFPFAVTEILSSGTTATATYYNLK